jgi:2-dehydropantoate 2-reductase
MSEDPGGSVMRFAIVGSGGLGCLFGGLLARAGADVTLIARGANLAALRERGLDVRFLSGEQFHVGVRATNDPGEVGPVDAVFFCVKTYDVEAAARQSLPLVGPETLFLPVQNGVEAAEQIGAIVGPDHVVTGVGRSGAVLEQPSVVVQKGATLLALFGPDRATEGRRAERIRDALIEAGIPTQVSPDVERELWEKFLIAVVGLGFMSINRLALGPTMACPESVEAVCGLVKEAVAVGYARGAPFSDDTTNRTLDRLHGMAAANPANRGSMYFDLLAGKRLELDAINGYVVRMGRALGIPTPFNLTVYGALKPYAEGSGAASA